MSGLLISVEGGDGAGKGTVLAALEAQLEQHGWPVLRTREPGGTELAEAIRGLLLDRSHQQMPPRSELLLIFAGRADHVERVIRPALAAGKAVLCDRYYDASYAYQGGGRGIPVGDIDLLTDWTVGTTRPLLTLLLDLPPAVGLARARARGVPDRIEVEQLEFFERVRSAYLAAQRREPERIVLIDAAQSPDEVASACCSALRRLLEQAPRQS